MKTSITTLLDRGTDTIYPNRKQLEEALQSKTKLRVYHGIDPTGAKLHIGHTVSLRKLRQFQELGHTTILLIGNFTAQIGDPTGKDKTRTPLKAEQIKENFKQYKEQAAHILDFEGENATQVVFNADWLKDMSFQDVIELASQFTVQQMLERDMFERRMNANQPIGVHEFLYPLMQGYDTVAVDADVEIGGSDQTFNMLAGRTLMKSLKGKEKFVLTTPLLADAKGRKIGKSEGNVIGITDEPNDLFGKIMALGDDAIIPLMILATNIDDKEIAETEKQLTAGANPKDYKERLAYEIVEMYHSKEAAHIAKEAFNNVFAKGKLPEDIITVESPNVRAKTLAQIMKDYGLTRSTSEASRLIDQGAVKINGIKVTDRAVLLPEEDFVLQVGKRKFRKFVKSK